MFHFVIFFMVGKHHYHYQMKSAMSDVFPMIELRRTSSGPPLPAATQSIAVSGIRRTIEPPVIRKSFPESWIFDSLIVDREYVLDSLLLIYFSMFGVQLFVEINKNFMLEEYNISLLWFHYIFVENRQAYVIQNVCKRCCCSVAEF